MGEEFCEGRIFIWNHCIGASLCSPLVQSSRGSQQWPAQPSYYYNCTQLCQPFNISLVKVESTHVVDLLFIFSMLLAIIHFWEDILSHSGHFAIAVPVLSRPRGHANFP